MRAAPDPSSPHRGVTVAGSHPCACCTFVRSHPQTYKDHAYTGFVDNHLTVANPPSANSSSVSRSHSNRLPHSCPCHYIVRRQICQLSAPPTPPPPRRRLHRPAPRPPRRSPLSHTLLLLLLVARAGDTISSATPSRTVRRQHSRMPLCVSWKRSAMARVRQ